MRAGRLGPRNSRDAIRSAIVVAVAAVALISTLSTLSVFWVPRASLGFALSGTTITAVMPNSTAARAGLKPGDRLIPSMGFAERLRLLWYDDFAPGQDVRLLIVHDGDVHALNVGAVQHRQPFSPVATWLVILRLLAYFVFIVVGAALVLLKPTRFSWGFFLCCLGLATLPGLIGRSASAVDATLGFAVYGMWLVVADLANVGFLAFALRFPTDEATGWRRVVWRSLPLWFIVLAGVDIWSMFAWYSGTEMPGWTQWAGTVAGIAAWAVATVSLAQTYRGASARNRKRLLWAIVGSSVGFLSWYLDGLLQAAGYDVAGQLVGFGTLALPLSVGYAVLKHRVVHVRFALNRALVISVVATSLVTILALTYWATTALLQQSHLAVYIQVAIALLAGVSLHTLYVRIKGAATRFIFRDLAQARQVIARVAAALRAAESYETLEDLLTREPVDELDLECAAVYRRVQDGAFERTLGAGVLVDMPARLDANDTLVLLASVDGSPVQSRHVRDRGAALAMPLFDAHVLRALVLFGPHRNGLDIDPDEVRVLETLAQPAGEAYRRLDSQANQVRKLAVALRDWDRGEFFAYLADQILASLPPSGRAVLLACAAVPDPNGREIALASADAGTPEHAAGLAHSSPFIERTSAGRYVIHAELRNALRARLADGGKSAILRCAADALGQSEFARAAELYIAADERVQALVALESLYAASHPQRLISLPHDHAHLIESIPAEALAGHAVLLALRLQLQSPLGDEPDVIDRAMSVLGAHGPGDAKRALAGWLAYALSESGDAIRAAHALVSYSASVANGNARHDDIDRLAHGMLLAKRGLLTDAEAVLDGAGPYAALIRATFVERARGRWADARAVFQLAFERVAEPSSPLSVAALADFLVIEWLAGDDKRCADIGRMLTETARQPGGLSFAYLVRNSAGGVDEPAAAAHPRHAAYSYLMSAANTDDRDIALRFLTRALERAASSGEPLVEAHVLVCLGELEPARRIERIGRAAAILEAFDDPAMFDALGAIDADGEHCGIFEPLVRRMRKTRTGRQIHLTIHLAGGVACSASSRLGLAEGELALLFALARTPGACDAQELIDALWPDHDAESALRALQSCVYRLRSRLGDASAVESVTQGYRLRSDVSVDLWNAEHFLSELKAGRAIDRFAIVRLDGMRRTFGRNPISPVSQWEWFAPVERRIAEVARAARIRLAEAWLHAGLHDKALECARELIAVDDLDEAGWELSIRAHVAAGSVTEGRREFRVYRELLARELAAEPPASLAALVAAEGNGHVH